MLKSLKSKLRQSGNSKNSCAALCQLNKQTMKQCPIVAFN